MKFLGCFNGAFGAAEVSAGATHLLKAGHPVGWVSVYTVQQEFPKPALLCLCSLAAPQLCVGGWFLLLNSYTEPTTVLLQAWGRCLGFTCSSPFSRLLEGFPTFPLRNLAILQQIAHYVLCSDSKHKPVLKPNYSPLCCPQEFLLFLETVIYQTSVC